MWVHDALPDERSHARYQIAAGRLFLFRGANDEGARSINRQGVDFSGDGRELHNDCACAFGSPYGRVDGQICSQTPMYPRLFCSSLNVQRMHSRNEGKFALGNCKNCSTNDNRSSSTTPCAMTCSESRTLVERIRRKFELASDMSAGGGRKRKRALHTAPRPAHRPSREWEPLNRARAD